MDFSSVDRTIADLETCLDTTREVSPTEELLVGVDLGTAFIVLVVMNSRKEPVACAMEFAQVIKDGLVVDYLGAMTVVKRLKAQLEERLGRELEKAAIAVPPGTGESDCKTHGYVVEGAGMEVTNLLDEPTAANAVLGVQDGVIVDIGGGTTGLSILEKGKVVYVADEATGGTHLSLVLSGAYKVSFEEAEEIKRDNTRHKEIFAAVRPVIQKMATIVKGHIVGRNIKAVYLVGGTCCLTGMETVFEKELGIPVHKPANPFLVTPMGIALSSVLTCEQESDHGC
ncbi:ethanolamine utilization protein EutJ [Desulfoluna spongiiphila]|uniref:ethanolamine utilization protein EutJ n=1 Tax=Desulfoluna spongiiphila TaxID=419481 RepID=UPI001250D699|nr:ethanolamine utilization protein EutJ [Desulfoluna spongiiphila]VVS91713.1 ethanolamine utilisation eutj [Desulfoluna spongiiphila]